MLVKRLKGAYGRVTSVENRESHQQLYSGSNAGDLLVWEPPAMIAAVEEREVDADEWSDYNDEDDII
ncbi:hypothetical protein RMATCC62417_10635 [Rhizopus microsporus]|nr:hypothetical protein RMATCC62417_10635 [Rhizopus microsporus]